MNEWRQIPDRDTWLEWRRFDVTSSDVAAVAKQSRWKSAYRVWAEKTGRAKPEPETNIMRRGRWLEDAGLAALAELKPSWTITKPRVYVRDPENRLAGTPDGFADVPELAGRVVVEIKAVAKPVFEEWQGELPIEYKLQALTLAMLTGAPKTIVGALVVDTFTAELEIFEVHRNAEAEAKVIEWVRAFWAGIALGIEPAPDYAEDHELVELLNPPREAIAPIDLSGDNALPALLDERELLSARKIADEERLKAIRAEVIAKLNGAPAGVLHGWKIRNRLIHKKERITAACDYQMLTIKRTKEATL